MKGALAPSLLLAGPGVLIGSFLMGLIVYGGMPFSWSWNLSMLFGSILSATDPVAVVALLKGAGASSKLTMLIIGESLMNDGTAMVLFTLFYNIMQGDRYDASGILQFFFSMSFGSVFLGLAFGLITLRVLRNLNRPLMPEDTILQIVMTFTCAYLSFYVAQAVFEISGDFEILSLIFFVFTFLFLFYYNRSIMLLQRWYSACLARTAYNSQSRVNAQCVGCCRMAV